MDRKNYTIGITGNQRPRWKTGANDMKEKGKAVDEQYSCPDFRHGYWSLEEEPSVCENCEFYDEGLCFKEEREAGKG